MNPLIKFIQSVRQLGWAKVWRYARYQLGVHSGYYRWVAPSQLAGEVGAPGLPPILSFPEISSAEVDRTLAEADEIRQGQVRLFGGDPVPLDLGAGASEQHWSILARTPPETYLKWIWEPGRFGWALTLARAYAFSGAAVYAEDFWRKTLRFLALHPPNLGRQWQSAQEVALRLMALVFCDRTLASAPQSTPERRLRLWQAVAEHAQRLPPTLIYARAQNNNHLLSEAAGLMTAGVYLPDHPKAARWRDLGWRWLNWGFQHQIHASGVYVQHSVNYHRLMLQLALSMDALRREKGDGAWPSKTLENLAAATRWLWALTDPQTGKAPNLGANDGAYIFPLTAQSFSDFRPVVEAAGRAFLGHGIYEAPHLHEMAAWFNLDCTAKPPLTQPQAGDMPRIESDQGRAFLHATTFEDRPSHADQLHADLWWRGVNVAQDPGTFSYNAPPPWDNALATARVHNTLTLDGLDQMRRAGRFLWLDWAQAEILTKEAGKNGRLRRIVAQHDGFRRRGVLHQRTLVATPNGWEVRDALLPTGAGRPEPHEAALTWLLPDWDWDLENDHHLRLAGPDFSFGLTLDGAQTLALYRAGACLAGNLPPQPTWGWTARTYGEKVPALLARVTSAGDLPLIIRTTWRF